MIAYAYLFNLKMLKLQWKWYYLSHIENGESYSSTFHKDSAECGTTTKQCRKET